MKRLSTSLVSRAPLLLIILALVAVQQRQGRIMQALPAALVGTGLVISSSIGRRRQRARLLAALRSSRQPSP